MALFYPHRQTLVIALICVIVVGSVAYFSFKDGSRAQTTSTVAMNTVTAPTILPDNGWQGQFFSTSTNGFNQKTASKNTSSTYGDAPLSATDLFGQEFMTKYMQMRQAGLTNDETTVSAVGSQLLQDSFDGINAPEPFMLSNIHIVTATDQATLQRYASSLSAILTSYIPDQDHNEATLAEQALESGNMDALSTIDPIIKNYKDALAALMEMPVPKPVASYHLNVMNGIALSLFNAQALRHVDTDPMKGMAAVGLEVQGLQFISDAVNQIQQYLAANGIVFG